MQVEMDRILSKELGIGKIIYHDKNISDKISEER
jgi:hypothetical protein